MIMRSMKEKIANKLNRIAYAIVQGTVGKVKIESIKYGEICLSSEIKVGEDESITEVSKSMQDTYMIKFKMLYDKLEKTGLDYDTGWNRVKVKNNSIICYMYYSGQFEIEEAKQALKEVGIR